MAEARRITALVNCSETTLVNTAADRLWLVDELPGDAAGKPQLFRAPGRVNIIGEHTDYSGGFVLPTTTATYTWAAASVRDDRYVNIRSLNLGDKQSFSVDNLEPSAEHGWIDYAKGVAALLQVNNINICGADIVIHSDIPIGGGLSSSAALEVVIATALLDLASATMSAVDVAQLCQQAEIEYAGVNCGVMDQFAVACCKRNNAVLLDCRSLESRNVEIPGDVQLLITDSGVIHALPEGDYNLRTRECIAAAEILAEHLIGFVSLRDLRPDDLEDNRSSLGDRLYRRCQHVVSENQRTLDAYTALELVDTKMLGELVSASHKSLRDDFEVSCDEVDALVEIADACDGVLGSRLIGAGFGGCVLSIIEATETENAMARIKSEYEAATGTAPWMHIVKPTDPATKVTRS